MSQRNLASALLVALLVAVTLAPKMWLEGRSAHIDIARLDADISARMQASGFRTAIDLETPGTAVRGRRGDCRIIVRNADRARELASVFRLDAAGYGQVLYGYRGEWGTRLPSWPSLAPRFVQEAAKRVGVDVSRPAVLAVALSRRCAVSGKTFAGLTAYAAVRGPRQTGT